MSRVFRFASFFAHSVGRRCSGTRPITIDAECHAPPATGVTHLDCGRLRKVGDTRRQRFSVARRQMARLRFSSRKWKHAAGVPRPSNGTIMNTSLLQRARRTVLAANSRWLLYTVTPDTGGAGARRRKRWSCEAADAVPAAGAAAAPANRNRVGLVDLRTGASSVLDDIQSYQMNSSGSYVALRRYGVPAKRGADVIVRDLDAGTELTLGNVAESAWNDDGSLLAIAIDADGGAGNGVQVLETRPDRIDSVARRGRHAVFSGIQWRPRRAMISLAMRSRTTTATFIDTSYTVLAWRGLASSIAQQIYDFAADKSFPTTAFASRATGRHSGRKTAARSSSASHRVSRSRVPPIAARPASCLRRVCRCGTGRTFANITSRKSRRIRC